MPYNVHPKIFRIRGMSDWLSRGFYGKNAKKNLEEDFKIRTLLEKKTKNMSVENIELERSSNKINIIISTAKPGLIIGRKGEGIELLKKALVKELGPEILKVINFEIKEIKDFWKSASLVAQFIVQQLEKRVTFRKLLKQCLAKVIIQKGVEGAKIQVSGRLDGVEIARTEWMKKGKLPRATIRADIDYKKTFAICRYGTIGVKVWIYKGELFD